LVVEAQEHMQQQKLKNASLLTSNLYSTQSYSTEPSLIEDQIRFQNSSLEIASTSGLAQENNCLQHSLINNKGALVLVFLFKQIWVL
jgi:hypothetical protein